MTLTISGDAVVARPFNQYSFKLTGADVMHWQPKSRLQQLWERLVQVVSQQGNPQ